MPNERELARTGLTFNHGFCNTAMCSPSRATLMSGRYPAEHGVKLTLTAADLRPDPSNAPAVAATMGRILRRHEAPPRRVLKQFVKGAAGLGLSTGHETELPTSVPMLGKLLGARGYRVVYKGKWHLTHPSGGEGALLGGWTAADGERIARDYGFHEWEAPDAGENAKAEHFGGGIAGEGEGWDEVYTQQVETWLAQESLPEPFCLIVSLVNPHDVLGYPGSYRAGGYTDDEFRGLGVQLPPTIDERLDHKPAVHSLMRMGMTAYMGPLRTQQQQLDYVNFYAHLHRLVDSKIGRILGAMGDPDDPDSLRSSTVIVRCADHGEMGLSHGGLRQKAFNAYEETINVPLVVSNPVLFSEPAETDALASLVDVLPTMLELTGEGAEPGLRGHGADPDRRCGRGGRARAGDPLAGRARARARPRGARGKRPGRDPLHLRRPPGRDGHGRGARAAQPRPRDPHGGREVRDLSGPQRQGVERVRDVRPRARSPRDREPPRRAHGRARGLRRERGSRDEMQERLSEAMAAAGTDAPE